MRRILLALVLLAAAGPAAAESGRTAAPFLQRALGARASGMGTAFAAVRWSLDSVQYNPAALSTLARPTLTSTYLNGFGGTNHSFIAYGQPLGRFGTLAPSLVYFDAGAIDLNLSDGTTGRVSAETDLAWALSYAVRTVFGIHVGATYRFIRINLAETVSATTTQGDFGALWETPLKGLSVGGAYQYVGPDITFEEVGDPPPRTFRYGLAYHFPDIDPTVIDPSVDLEEFDMTLALDQVHTLHERLSPRFGVEVGLKPSYISRVALRTGWVVGRDAESFTFGLGFSSGKLRLDYAFGRGKDVGHLQQFSLTIAF